MIRQVAGQGTGSRVTFGNDRLSNESDSIPRIDTNTTLPTVATPDDYAVLRRMESLNQSRGTGTAAAMREPQEILPSSQPSAPAVPVFTNRENTISPQAGIRVSGRNPGTRIDLIDSGSRTIQAMPLLSAAEDKEYENEDENKRPVLLEANDDADERIARADTRGMATRIFRDDDDTGTSRNLYAIPRIRDITPSNMSPSNPQESWDETARRALNLLNMRIADSDSLNHKEQLQDEINQRLMSLTLGNQRDALRPINGLPTELKEFWHYTLAGLSTMLDDVSFPDTSYRYSAAHQHLQTATTYLQNLCPVQIRKLSFISQCDGFGVFEPASHEFHRGESVFIYAEIDNLTCRETEDGFLAQVNSSYEIIDVLGNKVASGEFGKTGKLTQSRIRDVFLLWRVDLPENLMPERYFLRLSVADLNHPSHQFHQRSLEFNVLSPLSKR